jgi:haloalkane dehalogenase
MPRPDWLDTTQWPYDPRPVPLAEGRLHAVDVGTGPTTVFSHGTPTWSFEWRHLLAGLPGRRVALDHLGFGLSERPVADYSPEAHARRFSEAMDRLDLPAQVRLVVHDYGGPFALDWALRHPERVSELVVLNSFMWSFEDDPLMWRRAKAVDGALGRFLYRYLNASQRLIMPSAYGDRRKLTRAIHAQYLAVFEDREARVQVLWPLAKALTASSPYFRSLFERRAALNGTPVQVLWGLKDSAFQPPQLERWRQALPHARVTTLAAAGHWPHEEVPAEVLTALRSGV